MRVSLDVTAVPAQPVGAGRYTLDLVGALARHDDVSLVLWCRRDDAARWDRFAAADPAHPDPGHSVAPVAPRSRPARLAWEQLRLPSLLAKSGAQVHHGPHYTMPERSRLPMVVTVHDLTFFDHPQWHERSKVPVFRRAIRNAAARADALVCVSQRTADLLCRRVDVRAKVFVVPHGVDHGRFRPQEDEPGWDDEVLRRIGVAGPYILFVGTLEPRKAVPDLVAAFDSVASRNPELSLVLAGGQGWGADEVRRAVAASGHRQRIAQLGYVDDDCVAPLLRKAAAVAYPAHEEGFGLPALEALACGAPLVTSAGTAMGDMAGDAAILVPPGDVDALGNALAQCLNETVGIAERRRRGLERAASYTWEQSAAGHVAAYRWALEAHGDSGDATPGNRHAHDR